MPPSLERGRINPQIETHQERPVVTESSRQTLHNRISGESGHGWRLRGKRLQIFKGKTSILNVSDRLTFCAELIRHQKGLVKKKQAITSELEAT